MSTLIQVRSGTSAQWAAANPVLAAGEPGLDLTTGDVKYGNGVSQWSALSSPASRFVTVPTGWVGVTFTNSWVDNDAAHPCQYRKLGDQVYLRGLMKSGTVGLSAFTLPTGFRPTQDESFAIASNNAFGFLQTQITGSVVVITGSNVYATLYGIQFSVTG